MKNKLNLLDTRQGWIAVFTGKTGMGDHVVEEEELNIQGANKEERTQHVLAVWGA
ncbi:TPA: hypothetical protein I7256_22740 [Vibrio vulnificus]|nr:hypothetical protein [Vibrio vulnificus]